MKMLEWDIYEMTEGQTPIVGVNCRSTVRKFTIDKGITFIADNTQDVHGKVRFAILAGEDPSEIIGFLEKEFPGVQVEKRSSNVKNPVLSALYCNEKVI